MPRSVSAAVGNASGIVSFQPPTSDNGAAITAYTATATDLTNPARGNQAATGSASPLTVTGLAVGDRYTFSVSATNAIGQGPASAPSNVLIAKGVPGPPMLQSAVAGDGEVPLSWSGPTSNRRIAGNRV